MSNQNITSADAVITLTIPNLYPSGFELEEFEAQNIFDMSDSDMAEKVRTADGKLLAGYVFGDLQWTFHLSPSSDSINYVNTWANTEKAAKTKFRCFGTIILPSLGMKYTMNNGVLMRWRWIPSAGRVMQPIPGMIEWESITPERFSG
ncbi:TPA: phage tail fiber protein [Klebsiella aerogenes]